MAAGRRLRHTRRAAGSESFVGNSRQENFATRRARRSHAEGTTGRGQKSCQWSPGRGRGRSRALPASLQHTRVLQQRRGYRLRRGKGVGGMVMESNGFTPAALLAEAAPENLPVAPVLGQGALQVSPGSDSGAMTSPGATTTLRLASPPEHVFPKLTRAQMDRVAAHGRLRRVAAGEVLLKMGDSG